MLHPAPVGLAAGEARAFGEAVEGVVFVIRRLEPVLVPHGIGHDAVEGLEAVAGAEFGVLEGIPDLDAAFEVVDDHVHIGHGPTGRLVFLAVELERRVALLLPLLHPLAQDEVELDEETGGAAGGIVGVHARLRLHDARDDEADLGGRVLLATAAASAFGELADEVFVAAADDVRLDVAQAEALGADGLDEVGEAVVVEVALAVGGGVEVHAVEDALEQRVGVGDGAEVGRELFADLVGDRADDGPDGSSGVFGSSGR